MMNKWIGVGRLGRDAEMQTLPSGNSILKFAIAVDDSYMDTNKQWKERTYWVNVDITAPNLVNFYTNRLVKGTLLWVEGKLVTFTYNDQNGQTRSGFSINANNLHIISKPQQQVNTQTTVPNNQSFNNNNNPQTETNNIPFNTATSDLPPSL